MKLQKIILLSGLVSGCLLADISLDRVGGNIGIGYSDYSQKTNTINLQSNNPSKNFSALEVDGTFNGVFTNKSLQPFVSYTYSNNSDLTHQYLLAGVNKYYPHNDIIYYAGVYTGYSLFQWDYNPMNSTKENTYTSKSPLLGIQGGVEYPINENLSFDINLKTMIHDHNTQLESNSITDEINHDTTFFGGIGLVYRFGKKSY